MGQLDLFSPAPASTIEPERRSWEDFAEANPRVLAALIRWTEEARARGAGRVGMRSLFERIRWDPAFATDGEPFKINNSWTPTAARMIAQLRPDLAGLFEMRAVRRSKRGAQ